MATVSGKGLNIFTGAVNSNFSDLRNWSQQRVPSGSDTAIVAANCTFDIDRVLGALIVNPNATASIGSGRSVTVNGTLNIQGHLSASGAPNIYLRGPRNNINSLSPGTSTVYYDGTVDQNIPGITYYNLTIDQPSTNTAIGDITVRNDFSIVGRSSATTYTTFDLNYYNLTVSGAFSLGGGTNGTRNGRFIKSKPGGYLFVSKSMNLTAGSPGWSAIFDLSQANPIVELQGGISGNPYAMASFKSGNNLWRFTGNNQSIYNPYHSLAFDCPLHISGAITLTLDDTVVSQVAVPYIEGNVAGSKLVNKRNFDYTAGLIITTTTPVMSTGSFDVTSSANYVGYVFNSPYTLPKTTYSGLYVGGTGMKTVSGNLTVSGSLIIGSGNSTTVSGGLELGNFNLVVSGSTTLLGGTQFNSNSGGKFSKSGPGSILLIGNLGTANWNSIISFTGNPTVELRGGFSNGPYPYANIDTGTGSWIYSTNNQTLLNSYIITTYSGPVIISGSITVTAIPPGGGIPSTHIFNNTLNGTNANSTFVSFDNVYYNASQQPMLTGSLVMASGSNTFIYSGSGINQNITVPSGSKYYNLSLLGSGSKTLTGNTSVTNTLVTSSLITLITGSYTLTNP